MGNFYRLPCGTFSWSLSLEDGGYIGNRNYAFNHLLNLRIYQGPSELRIEQLTLVLKFQIKESALIKANSITQIHPCTHSSTIYAWSIKSLIDSLHVTQFPKKWSLITLAWSLWRQSTKYYLSKVTISDSWSHWIVSGWKIIVFLLPITVFVEQYKVTKKEKALRGRVLKIT